MTIGKKLYVNFGAVLAMVVVLFAVNLVAVYREHSAKAAASQALQLADATDKVRFQMMQNRLYLSNYLLSGDTREVDRMNEGIRNLVDRMQSTMGSSQLGPAASSTGEGAADRTELGQGIRRTAHGKAKRSGPGKLHSSRTADFLPAERCHFVGEEFDRIS